MSKTNISIHSLPDTDLLFNQLWGISIDGMRVIDEQGIMININDAFCKIVGMEKKDLLNHPFSIIYAQDQIENALEIYTQDLKNNALKTRFESERKLWNGKKVWFEFTNSFLEVPERGVFVLSVINDITTRKNAEIKLLESENRFKMLFNNTNDAVFLNLISEDNKLLKFIEVNNITCQLFGYAREDFMQMNSDSLVPPRFAAPLQESIQTLKKNGKAIFEMMLFARGRRQIPVEISAHLLNLDGQQAMLSVARDITERKQTEKRLRNSQQQLRNLATHLQTVREEERTMIARDIHDELGQVLTVLKIQTSLLGSKLKDCNPELVEKTNAITNIIDQTVDSVQKIISKLRPGILDELGLFPAIEWQIEEFRNNTPIQLNVSLPEKELSMDNEKSTALFRIFQEALVNAIRHAEAKKISVQIRVNTDQLTMEITDNGMGINESQINDPRSFGIMGMKERVLLLGGKVLIYGVPQKGTNVKVEVPLNGENLA